MRVQHVLFFVGVALSSLQVKGQHVPVGQQTLLQLTERACTQTMVKNAVREERLAKTTLQGVMGINGQPAAGNGNLVAAKTEATSKLQSLQENPECVAFLSDITPVADVQESVEKEARSKRDSKKESLAEFAKESDDKQRAKIAEEAEEKRALREEKLEALQEGGAEGALKEKDTKQTRLDDKAEERVMAEAQERSAKTMPAMEDILEAKKDELKKKFEINLFSIRKHATEEGFRLLIRAKEAGEKAFFSPGVRKETRLKAKKKYQKQDKITAEHRVKKDEKILQQAGSTNDVIAQLGQQHREKAVEMSAKVQTAASDPNLLNKIIAQETIDAAAKSHGTSDDATADDEDPIAKTDGDATKEEEEEKIDSRGVSNEGLLAAIHRFNSAITGKIDDATLRKVEIAADPGSPNATNDDSQSGTPTPSPTAGVFDATGSDPNGNSDTDNRDPDSNDAMGTNSSDSIQYGPAQNTQTHNNAGNSSDGIQYGPAHNTQSHTNAGAHDGTLSNTTANGNQGGEESGTDESTIEKIDGHECNAGNKIADYTDKCYTFEQCEDACKGMPTCNMFETNGCQCKFYDQKVDPVAAPGWTCGLKHESSSTGGDSSEKMEALLEEGGPPVMLSSIHPGSSPFTFDNTNSQIKRTKSDKTSIVHTLDSTEYTSYNPLDPQLASTY